MLVLFETSAGFALFNVPDKLVTKDLGKYFNNADSAKQVVKLEAFLKFEDTKEALKAVNRLIKGKTYKGLCKFLSTHCDGETLGVADPMLGNAINEKLQIECVHNDAVMELMRGIRSRLTDLIPDLNLAPMSLGVSHLLCRHKLKFNANKVDTMVMHAIGLLDNIDKDLNTYCTSVRELYGCHFPELAKIIQEDIPYVKFVKLIGDRVNAAKVDFGDILPGEVVVELKKAAVISVGTEVSEFDLLNIKDLCDHVLLLSDHISQLHEYLKGRMNSIAPNLTAMVGELVGARLIAHAGSMVKLAKMSGSTIQLVGSEKALFKALRTGRTPKYGHTYHAPLIVKCAPKFKGRMARALACKIALVLHFDALGAGNGKDNSMGLKNLAKLEAKLRDLEKKKKKSDGHEKKRKNKDEGVEDGEKSKKKRKLAG